MSLVQRNMYGEAAKASAPSCNTATKHTTRMATINPVVPLSNPAANVFRHVHPALLLSLLFLRFGALVKDPVAEMTTAVAVVTVLQVAYVLLCLPATGSGVAARKKLKPGEKRKKDEERGVSLVLTAIYSLILTFAAIIPVHVGFVLFGAPADTLILETGLVSALTALLALFPVFYARGVDSMSWIALAGLKAPVDEVFGGLVGCVAGAWLGAVPIPLDWDRDWQRWPVTIVVGMWMGGIVGRSFGGLMVKKPVAPALS